MPSLVYTWTTSRLVGFPHCFTNEQNFAHDLGILGRCCHVDAVSTGTLSICRLLLALLVLLLVPHTADGGAQEYVVPVARRANGLTSVPGTVAPRTARHWNILFHY